MKVVQIELKNYNRRSDDSVSFKCDSLYYKREYEKICQHYKDKFNEDLE